MNLLFDVLEGSLGAGEVSTMYHQILQKFVGDGVQRPLQQEET